MIDIEAAANCVGSAGQRDPFSSGSKTDSLIAKFPLTFVLQKPVVAENDFRYVFRDQNDGVLYFVSDAEWHSCLAGNDDVRSIGGLDGDSGRLT